MEAIRERCQQMRISELQTFLGENPQYLTACEDIYKSKYKRLYATICSVLVMSSVDCTIDNLDLNHLNITVTRSGGAPGIKYVMDLNGSVQVLSAFLANTNLEDNDDVIHFRFPHRILLSIYSTAIWPCDIPDLDNETEIDQGQYFEDVGDLYVFFYGLIKYNDPPNLTELEYEEQTVPEIIQRVMEFV